ncbi:YheU family protein [Shewanella marinintestina]|uniref:YheU family protein n=1 Tax=Shewanella marinintestina TaxID=190305 RepID=UPI00200FF1B6|nr:YheU family protein [Shewanella marinintestina]MCL1146191.1 YheU family protein [Shewanella marinintestina]
MLVPYESLAQLSSETFDNLIKEYLISQVEDGSFSGDGEHSMERAIIQCKAALKQGVLVVEYSEEEESIGIRRKEDIVVQDWQQD